MVPKGKVRDGVIVTGYAGEEKEEVATDAEAATHILPGVTIH